MRERGPHQAIGLYAHLTWHTRWRAPSICHADLPTISAALLSAGERTRVRVHAFAVLSEHVHLMVSYPPSVRLSDFVREAKSESARRANAGGDHRLPVQWCRGFYANAVCRKHLDVLRRYIGRQYRRHPDRIPA